MSEWVDRVFKVQGLRLKVGIFDRGVQEI